MSTAQQLGLIGNSIKVQSLPTASAETFGAGNRFYTLIGQQEGYITGHTYHTVVANDVYSWEDVAYGNYNMLDNIPVINQDLTSSDFTPVANTYYRHTGTITSTFTQGVIYYYDGTEYKALDGGGVGGISDVKVAGTSVVTDGVANIPPASETESGVVTTGAQTFSGVKKIKASPSGSVQLELEPNVPAKGRAYSRMRFNGITSYGDKYPFDIGMHQINNLSFVHMAGYSSTDFDFSNYDGRTFRININNGGYNRGQVNCGATSYQLYLESKGYYNAVPTSQGTLMSTPSTWSSGTSGSVTLSESGLYEIKASVGSGVFSTILNWDGSSICYSSSLGIQDTDAQALSLWHYEVGSTGILSLYKVDSTGSSTIDTTANISYRKIGIA